MTHKQLYLSVQNLHLAIEYANTTQDTRSVMNRLTASPSKGGLYGVGPFHAQQIVNIATKLGLITVTRHCERPTVAPSTATYRRLRLLGVENRRHAAEIIPFLSNELLESAGVVENKLCEVLREVFGTTGKMDVFVRGHFLFRVYRGGVYVVDIHGKMYKPQLAEAGFHDQYQPVFQWWKDSFVASDGTADILLTTKNGK